MGPRSTSIYGPLAAPIVVLIWLYFLAIAVLIGAALNAATRQLWPARDRPRRRFRTGGGMAAQSSADEASDRTRTNQASPPRPLTPLPPGVLEATRTSSSDRNAVVDTEIEVTGPTTRA